MILHRQIHVSDKKILLDDYPFQGKRPTHHPFVIPERDCLKEHFLSLLIEIRDAHK